MSRVSNKFSWKKVPQIEGDWLLSPNGEMCKAIRLSGGRCIVLRHNGSGFWEGPEDELMRTFKPLSPKSDTCILF